MFRQFNYELLVEGFCKHLPFPVYLYLKAGLFTAGFIYQYSVFGFVQVAISS